MGRGIQGGNKIMFNMKEYPRGGVMNGDVVNRTEMHVPCVVLLDTSSSMACVKDQLERGLDTLVNSLSDQAKGCVEFCIISFDDEARIISPFAPVYDFETPAIDCDGMTAMHAAVKLGLSEIEARKNQYKQEHVPYYRPWIFMLTDGGANDSDNGEFDELLQSQKDCHCTFFPVGIGKDADIGLLKTLREDGLVLKACKENFVGAFEWLSNSMSRVSDSKGERTAKLTSPGNYQLDVEVDVM